MSELWVGVQGSRFVDSKGRQVILRGLNVGGDGKLPYPDGGTHHPTDFSDHRSVSFVGRPFPLERADEHFARIAGWGFNVIRLVVTWEAVEHAGPGLYDLEFIEYIGGICERAQAFGLAVLVDFHQDVWSRMSGGSGAPGWVFERLGLDFRTFDRAGAAHVIQYRYDYASPQARQDSRYPMMSWTRNYQMPVNGILWTAFFAGSLFTPQWRVEGRNVQDYLQGHLFGAMQALARRLRDLPNVLGFDSLNEPGLGWLGQPLSGNRSEPDATTAPPRRGSIAWTPLDGLKVARGLAVSLPVTDGTAPLEVNTARIPIWMAGAIDPFEQAGAWRLDHGRAVVLDEQFFCRNAAGQPLQIEQDCLMPYFRDMAQAVRQVRPDWLMFAEINPHATARGRTFPQPMPPGTVNASHWYDTALLWNKSFPVDLESSQETELKQRYRRSLSHLRGLGDRINGGAPTLIGEFGIPYDLNDGDSFRLWAAGSRGPQVWKAQTQALRLAYDVLDELLLSSTQWNYTAANRNDLRIGDGWNQEDLSVFSYDQVEAGSDGGRAIEGFCRPYVRRTQGTLLSMRYDGRLASLAFELHADPGIDAPTEVFIPRWLCQEPRVELTPGGHWHYTADAQCVLIRARQAGTLKALIHLKSGATQERRLAG